jgi:hypothetical protein
VQWIGEDSDAFVTFTITAREILSAADSNVLWTDQDVQRGVKPEFPNAGKLLSLASGYPSDQYIFVSENADDIADKLLNGDKLFLSPLIWNIRPGSFEAFYDKDNSSLYIYSGKIFLPDSHHRHQAILKACRIFEEAPQDYPKFSLDKQFKIELYFLSREDEGDYFFDKNQRTRQTAKSKAYDLTNQDALSLLAKRVASKSTALEGNVNRVTDRLTGKNSQVMTLSALREMMKSVSTYDHMDDSELEGLATIAAEFYDLLATIRPELGKLGVSERKETRSKSLVDAGVMMQGYASLIKAYQGDISKLGSSAAERKWRERLPRLSASNEYSFEGWSGDLFDKENPFWQRVGILKPNRSRTGFSIVSNGATRSEAGRVMTQIIQSDTPVQLSQIVNP